MVADRDCSRTNRSCLGLLRRTRDVRIGSSLCENSTRYKRTLNFEACGHAQSKKMQKFVLRSALRPNQISFSHSLGQNEPSKHVRVGGSCLLKAAIDGRVAMKIPRRQFLHLATGAAVLPTMSRIAKSPTHKDLITF